MGREVRMRPRSFLEAERLWRWIRGEDVPTRPLVLRTLVYPREAILRIRRAVQKGIPAFAAINRERGRLLRMDFAEQANPRRKEVPGNRRSDCAGAVHPVGDAREAQPEHGRVGQGRATRNREAMKGESLIEEVLTVLMLVALWLMWLMVPA
ncbi:MAG: hypothetical protein A3H27_02130 [Acidobacteria bacterium RIFCSPLOWO2_02_FULL_59_13]|nr:MAG: hypothetical protein A3H27_02130 [Acidobacteria bacterium RIFCSPLOWO2_02_FULL_59_13]